MNINDEKIANHSNRNYAAGFIVAHELTHQLLTIASHYSGYDDDPINHDNTNVNLMNRGIYSHIPAGPIPNILQDEERIPDSFRAFLDRFYLTPEKRKR